MRKRSELIFNLLLVPMDFVTITAAFVLAYIIRVKIDARPVADPIQAVLFLKIILFVIPVWLLIFSVTGLYSMTSQRGRLREIGRVFVAVSGGTMFMILIDFLFRQPIFPSKAVPVYGYMLAFVLSVTGRQLMRKIQRYLLKFQIGVRRVLLVGSGPIARRILADLQGPDSGYEVVAVADARAIKANAFPGIKSYKDFDRALSGNGRVDEIIQADTTYDPDEVLAMISYATNHQIAYRFVPNQFGVYAINAEIGTLAGVPIMQIRHTPLDGWGRILKRAFDVAGSVAGLLVLSPLMAAIALVIKASDSGSVIFRHERVSRSGRKVKVYKFRTMYERYSTSGRKTDEQVFKSMGRQDLAAEFAKHRKPPNDPRVTPVGRWLRRTSLDELPQLVNVLRGELSLVGPRPVIREELAKYGEGQATFLALKPGLTGLWQISGRSDIGFDERVKLDIYYVENWSLWLDLKILAKTVLAVMRGQGAY